MSDTDQIIAEMVADGSISTRLDAATGDRLLLVIEEMEQEATAAESHCNHPPCEMAWGIRKVTDRFREAFNLIEGMGRSS